MADLYEQWIGQENGQKGQFITKNGRVIFIGGPGGGGGSSFGSTPFVAKNGIAIADEYDEELGKVVLRTNQDSIISGLEAEHAELEEMSKTGDLRGPAFERYVGISGTINVLRNARDAALQEYNAMVKKG